MEERKLIRAYDVGQRLGYTTATIKHWAKLGRLPGAVFIGRHVRFDPEQVEAFIRAGGQRPQLATTGSHLNMNIRHHGHRAHAGGQPRNDRSRRDPAKALGYLVQPDPGVREFDPMAEAPDLARVPAARYLPGGNRL